MILLNMKKILIKAIEKLERKMKRELDNASNKYSEVKRKLVKVKA